MKKKKLQFLVSLAQIISSLAVLISIFLLIIEYKRSGTLNERSISPQNFWSTSERTSDEPVAPFEMWA